MVSEMIKNFIINQSLHLVSDIYPDYNESKMDEIRYGLEAIYLSLTKVVVILLVTLILGIFKEAVIVLLLFNGLRSFAFGIHAKKSWMCWVSSSIFFIGIPYLCIYVNIPTIIQYMMICFSIICFLLYAPADTKKRPLVRKNRRIKFKILTLIVAFLYILVFFNIQNIFIKNVIASVMLLESVLIHPLTYRMFKLSYKNYEGYVFSK
jgi:accessory gene regulator B